MLEKSRNYKNLVVWQKGIELVVEVYTLTEQFPKSEIFGLSSQMRRCSVSILSNIAEGSKRGSPKDFRQFLLIAFGSGAELETQVEIAKRLVFSKTLNFSKIDNLLNEVMRILNVMTHNLKTIN